MGWRYDTPEGVHDDDTLAVWDESTDPPTKVRDYTVEEQANAQARADAAAQAATEQDNAATLTADAATDETKIVAAIEDLRIILADNATAGSLRQVRGTVTNQYSAAVMRALIDVLITQAQANRRVARQLLRVQRLATGDFDSADAGVE